MAPRDDYRLAALGLKIGELTARKVRDLGFVAHQKVPLSIQTRNEHKRLHARGHEPPKVGDKGCPEIRHFFQVDEQLGKVRRRAFLEHLSDGLGPLMVWKRQDPEQAGTE